jgi:hypothetical protein
MVEDGSESVFVQSRERLGSCLDKGENTAPISQISAYEEAFFKVALEFLNDEAGLFPARNVGHPPLQEHTARLNKSRYACPTDFVKSLMRECRDLALGGAGTEFLLKLSLLFFRDLKEG